MIIHYVSFYLNQNEIKGRKIEVAAQTKVRYILKTLKTIGYNVNIVSTVFNDENMPFSKFKQVIIDVRETHYYLAAQSTKNIFLSKFKALFMQVQLIKYILMFVRKGDIVLTYHSLAYTHVISFLKIFKKYKLILELNDFYSLYFNDKHKSFRINKKEINSFKGADSFILASKFMFEDLDKEKPFIINYGSYEPRKSSCIDICKENVHVAYTGIIENLRGAAKLAANAARYLPKGFYMHIAGFGNDNDIKDLIQICNDVNSSRGYEVIKFHGLLLGNEYDNLISNCCISLNTHSYLDNEIWKSKYSFPSKIPLNMSYNNYFVSHDMELIKYSPFSECIEFYDEFDPIQVANAIERCSEKIINKEFKRNPSELIVELDKNFKSSLCNLIEVTKIS